MAQHRDVTLGREMFASRLDKAGSHITDFNVSEKSIQNCVLPMLRNFEMKNYLYLGMWGIAEFIHYGRIIYTVKKKPK